MDPLILSAIGGNLQTGAGFAEGIAHLMWGIQKQQAAQFQADQLKDNANAAEAAAQRDAAEAARQAQLVMSRSLAVAAASGGGASDPTIVSIIARQAEQGAYNQAAALYQGQSQARVMRLQAKAKEYEGEMTALNSAVESVGSFAKASGSLVGSQARNASLYQRFGGDGPKIGNDPT